MQLLMCVCATIDIVFLDKNTGVSIGNSVIIQELKFAMF